MIDTASRDSKNGKPYATQQLTGVMNLKYITDTKGQKSAVQLPDRFLWRTCTVGDYEGESVRG